MVDTAAAIADLRLHGRPLHGALRHLGRLTGDHPPHKAGIFLAAGPAIRNVPLATRISVHDVTPTLLLALGLPIADDFAGRPVTELFTEEFVRNRQVRRIASWGVREAGAAPRTADDRKLLEELAGLGYLR
jgi:hypothetical protein